MAYITGWRFKSEILTRQKRHVDLKAGWLRLDANETKNDEGRMVLHPRAGAAGRAPPSGDAGAGAGKRHDQPVVVPPRRQAHQELPSRLAHRLSQRPASPREATRA